MDYCTEVIEETEANDTKRRKSNIDGNEETIIKKQKLQIEDVATSTQLSTKTEAAIKPIINHQHQSPKKRLEIVWEKTSKITSKEKFIYGNYSKYYGYRNKGKDFKDIRLDVFETHRTLFEEKEILDIGCNSGFITVELAKRFPIKHITGIDIDSRLINQACKYVTKQKKATHRSDALTDGKFPFNITFLHGNYVLRDDVLLQIEREQFDLILCLSVTKWIHLNFGDSGLRQSFKRMFLQLRSGGKLILEPQSFDNYGRRKRITENIFSNYRAIKFFPKDFSDYLLSTEVGFESVTLMAVPEHCVAGFKRPIYIFNKT